MQGQLDIFDYIREPISITNPIRLIELFAGYGSQAMALERIGAEFEHYRIVEFDIVNIGLHFFHKDVRLYAASCSEV